MAARGAAHLPSVGADRAVGHQIAGAAGRTAQDHATQPLSSRPCAHRVTGLSRFCAGWQGRRAVIGASRMSRSACPRPLACAKAGPRWWRASPGREGPGGGMAGIVQFENVGLRYGTGAETLSDLSFSLAQGGFYFLTGPSGAGKTSLLKMLYLAQRPSRGSIRLFGEDVVQLRRARLPGFRRRIGVVFQDFRLIPHLSAFDNIALPLRIAGVDERDLVTPVREMLAWVGLADRASARPADAVGRRAAARRDRARGDRPPRDPRRRRADRQCRSRNGGAAAPPVRCAQHARHDDRRRDARHPSAQPRRQGERDAARSRPARTIRPARCATRPTPAPRFDTGGQAPDARRRRRPIAGCCPRAGSPGRCRG